MNPTDTWNPEVYNRFEKERQQPFVDLMSLVRINPVMRVADLGCGTGRLTRVLHERLRAASTIGFDSSDNMLHEAKQQDVPNLRFERRDLQTFSSKGEFDLIFSNAALQHVSDHPSLFARLTDALAEGGQLAVQMPAMEDSPYHRLAAEIASRQPYHAASGGFVYRLQTLPPQDYATLLHELGYAEQHVRLQVYPHLLPSRDHLIEWYRGAALTTYAKRLPPDLFQQFPDASPFFFPFRRLLMVGYR